MMRRVLLVTTFYPPYSFGGDAVDMQVWADALARRGCDVTVVHDLDAYQTLAAPTGLPSPGPLPGGGGAAQPGVEVIGLRSRLGRLGLLMTHQTGHPVVHGAALRRLCAERGFDTVLFANVSLMGGPAVFAICPGAVHVFVATEHWLICPTHVLWRYDGRPCDERRCLRCTLLHRRPPQLWRHAGLLDRAARDIDVFVARSEFSRRKHREYGFLPPMEVVPCFVAAPSPSRAPSRSPHARPYFLFAGRVEELKGLADVLPLFMHERGADLVIAGTGAAEAALRAASAASPHVRWLGFVPRDELARWYRHAVALVMPSVTYETFGIVVIEALSHGTPVIARRRGPLPELIERGGGGVLFDTADQLDAALRDILADDRMRKTLAAQAEASFRANFSEEAVLPRFLGIVEAARQRLTAAVSDRMAVGP
ncbi:MAG: glycosyltransferase family 4 protein [Acidobacteriota bacterium]